MINRWKVLPHRLSDGKCRDCGRYAAITAPDNCPRCMLELRRDAGFFTIENPVAAFEQQGREMWREVARQLRCGDLRSGRFYLWIGHGDGGPLERPLDELLPNERVFSDATLAHETGLDLTRRYPQVWVVTTVGCWDITSGMP